MAAYFDLPVVLRMVSTAGALEMVRRMRQLYPQARVYVEVCVHYLFLTEDALLAQGGRALIHPPLRTQRDLAALWRGLEDHTVDYIASDHAPHAPCEKESDNLSAVSYTHLGELKSEIKIPYGVNCLWDPNASLDLAMAVDGQFIREIISGVYALSLIHI